MQTPLFKDVKTASFKCVTDNYVISFLSKVMEEHIQLLEALCRICGGNMRKWQSKTGSGVTANKMAVALYWRSVSCLRRAVSNGNVTPTAIQSLHVSWLRRFPRNKLNVFSLVIKLLLQPCSNILRRVKRFRSGSMKIRTADCGLGINKTRTKRQTLCDKCADNNFVWKNVQPNFTFI